MIVAHVTSNLQSHIGGAERYLIEIAKAQAKKGDSVHIVTTKISSELRSEIEHDNITVHLVKRFRPYPAGSKGRHVLEKIAFHLLDIVDSLFRRDLKFLQGKENFEVIHWHRFQGIGITPTRPNSTLHFLTVHDHSLINTSSLGDRLGNSTFQVWRRLFYRRILKRVGVIVFPSQTVFSRHVAARLVRESDQRALVLGHGWKLDIPDKVEAESANSATRVRYLYLGALSEQKGFRTVMDAWQEIPDSDSTLTIAGLGPLEALAKERASKRISYVGWVSGEEKFRLLNSHDAVIVPSTVPEVFCLVIAEATILGIPVICSDLARPYYLEPEENCLEFQAGSTSALAKSIIRLESERSLLSGLSENIKLASKHLDFDIHVTKIRSLYDAFRKEGHHEK